MKNQSIFDNLTLPQAGRPRSLRAWVLAEEASQSQDKAHRWARNSGNQ